VLFTGGGSFVQFSNKAEAETTPKVFDFEQKMTSTAKY